MWFHGSAWPPGNHGIMPVGSCHSAMPSTVAWRSDAETRPGTSMGTASDLPYRLLGVDHEALAEHRVEEALGPAGEGAHRLLLGDVPEQDLQVGLHQRVVVVLGADRALEPPVGRV